ncbi:hypothetical protein AB1N83_013846, partial [Pleurotus pulmonarius]
RRRRRR